jgi:hypothetical protein
MEILAFIMNSPIASFFGAGWLLILEQHAVSRLRFTDRRSVSDEGGRYVLAREVREMFGLSMRFGGEMFPEIRHFILR